MKTLTLSTTIQAPVQRVWDTMLNDVTYRQWTAPFNPNGSWYEGTLEAGAPIRFIGPDEQGKRGGMLSRVAVFEPGKKISFEHYGEIRDDVEDTTSERVKAWAGSHETYLFEETEGKTQLTVQLDVPEDFASFMEKAWPKALEVLQKLCEQKTSA